MGDLPPDTLCVQPTYFQTSPQLERCLVVGLDMTQEQEDEVVDRLRWLARPENAEHTKEKVSWCVQMLLRLPNNDKIIAGALGVIEVSAGILDNVSDHVECLADLLQKHPDKSGVQSMGYSVLRKVLAKIVPEQVGRAMDILSEKEFFRTAVQALDGHLDNARVVAEALSCMLVIFETNSSSVEECLLDPSILILLGSLAGRYERNVHIAPLLLSVLVHLSLSQAFLPSVDVAATVIQMVTRMHIALPNLPTAALQNILNLIGDEVAANTYFVEGPIHFHEHRETLRELAQARKRETLMGRLSTILQMCRGPMFQDLIPIVFSCIHRIAANGPTRGEPALDVPLILDALDAYPSAVQMDAAAPAFSALCHAVPGTFVGDAMAQRVHFALAALDWYVGSLQSFETTVTCAFLTKIFHCNVSAREIAGVDGVDRLTAAFVAFNSECHVLIHCASALLLMCEDEQNRRHFAEWALVVQSDSSARGFVNRAMSCFRLYENATLRALLLGLFRSACAVSGAFAKHCMERGVHLTVKKTLKSSAAAGELPLLTISIGLARLLVQDTDDATNIAGDQSLELLLDISQKFGEMSHLHNDTSSIRYFQVFAEASYCVLRLTLYNPDARKSLTRLINYTSVGYRTPEIVRIDWDGHEFVVADRVEETLRRQGTRDWLHMWNPITSWFSGDPQVAAYARLQLALAEAELVVTNAQLVEGLDFKV